MNTQSKPDHDLIDDVLIFACKGVAWIFAGIGVICATILLYGFVKNVLLPALIGL